MASAKKEKVKQAQSSKVKETFGELKKVSWPSFGKVVKNTAIVLAVVIVFALVLWGIDYLLVLLHGVLVG